MSSLKIRITRLEKKRRLSSNATFDVDAYFEHLDDEALHSMVSLLRKIVRYEQTGEEATVTPEEQAMIPHLKAYAEAVAQDTTD